MVFEFSISAEMIFALSICFAALGILLGIKLRIDRRRSESDRANRTLLEQLRNTVEKNPLSG